MAPKVIFWNSGELIGHVIMHYRRFSVFLVTLWLCFSKYHWSPCDKVGSDFFQEGLWLSLLVSLKECPLPNRLLPPSPPTEVMYKEGDLRLQIKENTVQWRFRKMRGHRPEGPHKVLGSILILTPGTALPTTGLKR